MNPLTQRMDPPELKMSEPGDRPAGESGLDTSKLKSIGLNFFYDKFQALHDINLTVHVNRVTAFIGPSGCGKSTFLRTLNRMHETIRKTRLEGEILLDNESILTQ